MVVGAPNIEDFAPSPTSVLHIKEVKDVDSIAKKMKYLAENPSAYNETLRSAFNYQFLVWGYEARESLISIHLYPADMSLYPLLWRDG